MNTTRPILSTITILLFSFFAVEIAISATETGRKQLPAKAKNRRKITQPTTRYETEKEKQERLRRWGKSDEAKKRLQEMHGKRLERFEATQADRRRRKVEDSTEGEESYNKKIIFLKREIARLQSTVNELEERVNLIEAIMINEDPNFIVQVEQQNLDLSENKDKK